jgi:hypothetical protein
MAVRARRAATSRSTGVSMAMAIAYFLILLLPSLLIIW